MIKKGWFLLWLLIVYSAFISPSYSNEAQDLITKGNEWVKKQNYEEAVKEYKRALEKDPKNVKANLFLGLTYANIGKIDEGLPYALKAAEIDPSYTSYYNLGLIYAAKSEPEKALQAFAKALEINPTSYMAEYQKGIVYASQKSYDKAAESYKRAVELNPNFDEGRLALASASYQQGDKTEALNQVAKFRGMKKDMLAEALNDWIEEREKGSAGSSAGATQEEPAKP